VTIVSLGTYFFYSEYFTITYPLVRDTYLSWSMPAAVIFLNDATLIFAVALVSVLVARQKSKSDPALLVAMLASAGFAVSFFLQRRGWAYHSYPMVAIALLAMGYVLTGVGGTESRPRRFAAASIFVMAATFAFGMLWFNTTVYVGPIKEAIAGLKSNPRILVLSGEAAIGHPLVRDVGGCGFPAGESVAESVYAGDARKDLCRRCDRCPAERLSGAGAQMADRGFQEIAA
jgi:hypothetical protein